MAVAEQTRVLGPDDESLVLAFLRRNVERNVVLLSNVTRAGLVDRGKRRQATYAAHFEASGAMTALAAHSWTGWLALEGGIGLEGAATLALRSSGRSVLGLLGPGAAVNRVQEALGRPVVRQSTEVLFALDLSALQVPELLTHGDVRPRRATEAEARDVLAAWRVEYEVEVLSAPRGSELERRASEGSTALAREGRLWLLEVDSAVVSMSSTGADADGIVQISTVYTPPAHRGRGYARSVVAGSLLDARANGATGSTLFTGVADLTAQRAYRALGYHEAGDYGFVFY